MASKNKRQTNSIGFPIDERPVIFNLIDNEEVNYIGRYIESESMFMTSLNDTNSDFVSAQDIYEWWYIDEHPTVISEVLDKKKTKKDKKKENKKTNKSKESNIEVSNPEPEQFQAPKLPPLPPFIKDIVRDMQNKLGFNFNQVNIRIVGENDLDTLDINSLEQILSKAVEDENFELATKIRDCIKSKNNNDA